MNSLPPMKLISGRARAIEQLTVTTEHIIGVDNLNLTEVSSQYVVLVLDGVDTPLTLNSFDPSTLFIGEGDAVEVAGIRQGNRVDVYGIRNVTDGSVYLVRPAGMYSWFGSYLVAGICTFSACGTLLTMGLGGERDPAAYLQVIGIAAAIASVPFGLGLLGRRLGYSNRAVEAHSQSGGKQEMIDAQSILQLTPDELKRIRRLG